MKNEGPAKVARIRHVPALFINHYSFSINDFTFLATSLPSRVIMLKNLFSLDTLSTKRVFGLDVMRAVAILIVVDAHATIALNEYYSGAFWHQLLPDGVELFFVLSGFLIGGILIRTYVKNGRFDGRLLLNFWTRRWFRTLPAYYLVVVGLIGYALLRAWRSGLHHALPPASTLIRYFFFVQNFASYVPDFFTESWSLAIEEWSYITLPLLLWTLHALLHNRLPPRRIVLTTVLLVIVGTNVYRFITALQIPISAGELGYRGIVITRLDAISYGVLAAWVKQYFPAWWTNPAVRRRLLVAGLLLTGIAAFSASIVILKFYVEVGIYPAYVFYKRSFYFLFIGLSMTLLLPYMDGWQTLGNGINGERKQPVGRTMIQTGIIRVVTHISLISYSMYLLNLTPIMINIIERIPTTSLPVGWLKVGLFWSLVLVLSTLLFKFFEKPATQLRERLSAKEPTELVPERAIE